MTRTLPIADGTTATPVPSRASVFGHPLHPSLIPLPIGLLTGAFVSDAVAQTSDDEFWPRASRYLLAAGLTTGLVAGAVGAVDYYGLERPRQLAQGRWHARGNIAAMAMTASNLAMRRRGERVTRRGFALSAAVAGVLAVTGALGGEMSYRYLVGVAPKEINR